MPLTPASQGSAPSKTVQEVRIRAMTHLKEQERGCVAVSVSQQVQEPGLQLGHAARVRPQPGLLPGLGSQQGCQQGAALLQRLAALHQLLQLLAVACAHVQTLRGRLAMSTTS